MRRKGDTSNYRQHNASRFIQFNAQAITEPATLKPTFLSQSCKKRFRICFERSLHVRRKRCVLRQLPGAQCPSSNCLASLYARSSERASRGDRSKQRPGWRFAFLVRAPFGTGPFEPSKAPVRCQLARLRSWKQKVVLGGFRPRHAGCYEGLIHWNKGRGMLEEKLSECFTDKAGYIAPS